MNKDKFPSVLAKKDIAEEKHMLDNKLDKIPVTGLQIMFPMILESFMTVLY